MTEIRDDASKAGDRLCLRARDEDDLQVIAACLQDALVPLREMAYMADDQRFMAAFNRFQWERIDRSGDVESLTLSQSALCIDHVDAVQYRGLDGELDGVKFELLTIMAEPLDAGAHQISLLFAGDVALRLQVSDISITLQDFGEAWAAGVVPHHDLSDIFRRDS
ncbi:MAG: DUF2948 family protein [Pseudomonadota bacterium]